MTYTPGPWEHNDRGGMGWDVDGPPHGMRGMFLLEADARLAAAAPDLLAALEVVLERHELPERFPICLCGICNLSRAAIAKAKGEA